MTIDILEKFIVSADIAGYAIGERRMAVRHLSDLDKLGLTKCIIMADRGYWSPELIAEICESGRKFLFRIQKNTSKTVRVSDSSSGIFKVKHNRKTYRLRFFKFVLPSGDVEFLATNLAFDEVSDKELAELYFMRWGIESKYNELKSFLQIENFTGKTSLIVKQDFFATLYLSNIIAFAKFQADDIIEAQRVGKHNKLTYQLNINVAAGIFKDRFIKILLQDSSFLQSFMLNSLVSDISRFVSPIRPNRKSFRNPNHRKPHLAISRKSAF